MHCLRLFGCLARPFLRVPLAAIATVLPVSALATVANEPDAAAREQLVRVPASSPAETELAVSVVLPAGPGPFPVALIQHDRERDAATVLQRSQRVAQEFVRRGYAVVMAEPVARPAAADGLPACDVRAQAQAQAAQMRRTLDGVQRQPWADVSRNLVLGQGLGSLAVLAYGAAPHPGTRLLVSAGSGQWPARCADWARDWGQLLGEQAGRTTVPSLWFAGEDEAEQPSEVWRALHQRYLQAGARTEWAIGVPGSAQPGFAGAPIWAAPLLGAMLAGGLPVVGPVAPGERTTGGSAVRPRVRVEEIEHLPLQSVSSHEGYQAWLAARGPKAFAIHVGRNVWGSAWGGKRSYVQALANCEQRASEPCTLYAVDETVVWQP